MTKIIPATSDVLFKALLAKPELKPILITLISFIADIPASLLEGIEIESTEYYVDNKNNKQNRSDIVASISGNIINLEMNTSSTSAARAKNASYVHKLKAGSYIKGKKYTESPRVIQINFNDFKHYKGNKEIYRFRLREEDTLEVDENSIEVYYVELPKIWDRCYNKDVNEMTQFEKICLLLKTDDLDYAKNIARDDEELKEMVEKMENLNENDWIKSIHVRELTEEEIMESAREDGFREGHKEGLEQGVAEGIEQGIEQAKIEMIKSMYKNGLEIEPIAKVAEISVSEVESILNIQN